MRKSLIICILVFLMTAGFLQPIHATTEQWSWMGRLPISAGAGALWGSAANNVFGVGNYGETIHYDGEQWTALKFPSGAPSGLMRDVWGSDENNVFAVGANGLLLKYIPNKASETDPDWEVMKNPQENYPGYPYNPQHLYGVWGSSANNVFAVGASGTILHYNGTEWSVVAQQYGAPSYALMAVWGSSENNIYIAGRGVILHSSDGMTWEKITPERPNYKNHGEIIKYGDYRDVWGSDANNIFVVGDELTWEVGDNFREELILHSSDGGGSWHRMTLPATRPYCDLCDQQTDCKSICDNQYAFGIRGVWGTSANNVYAVGYQGTFLHYDGVAWSYVWDGIDPPDYRHNWLDGLWGIDANQMFFTGEHNVYTNAQNQHGLLSLSFTDPLEGGFFESNETFKVNVDVNNPSDITIERIDLAVNGEKIEEMEAAPYLTYWRAPASGACTLTATAIDSDGAVLSETSLTVNITEQSSNKQVLFPVDDTFVQGGKDADQNYGWKAEMVIKAGSGKYLRYGFSKFDLSRISGDIESAELHYFCRQHYETGFKFYFVADDDWDEDALTFNTQPAFGQFLGEASLSSEQVALDITQIVRQELSGDAMLSLGIKGTADYFASLKTKESKYINLHPYLIVRTVDSD